MIRSIYSRILRASMLSALCLCHAVSAGATQFCETLLTTSHVGAQPGNFPNDQLYFTASKTGSNETTFKLSSTTSTLTGKFEAVMQIPGGGTLSGDFNSDWNMVNGELTKVATWTTYPSSNIQIYLVARRDNSLGGSDITGAQILNIDVSGTCSSATKICQQACSATIQNTPRTIYVSMGTVGTDQYRIVFESDFDMTGSLTYIRTSSNNNQCIDGLVTVKDNGRRLFFDITSSSAPTFVNNLMVKTSQGNWTMTGIDLNNVDWSQTSAECAALEDPMPTAVCSGSSTVYATDTQGYGSDGYEYTFTYEPAARTLTVVYNYLDWPVGAVNPEVWNVLTNTNITSGLVRSGQSVTVTLSNVAAGTAFRFRSHLPYAAGEFWTDNVDYNAGDVCSFDPCAGEEEPAQTTLWFVNTAKWSIGNVKVYAWNGGTNNGWPGEAMTNTGIKNQYDERLYSFTFDKDQYANVIFSNNGSSQSADLNVSDGKFRAFNYAQNAWVQPPQKVSFCYGVTGSDATWGTDVNVMSPVCFTLDYTCTVTLDASTTYQMKIAENDADWYGCEPATAPTASFNNYACSTSAGNLSFTSGLCGEYVIKWNYVTKTVSVTYPAAPSIISASRNTLGCYSVVLNVASTSGTKYNVTWDGGSALNLVPDNGTITVTGLAAHTAYTFTVKAVDDCGNESSNSKTVSVTTLRDAPTALPTKRKLTYDCQMLGYFDSKASSNTGLIPYTWCGGSNVNNYRVDGKDILLGQGATNPGNCLGYGTPDGKHDVTAFTHLHLAVWTPEAVSDLQVYPINSGKTENYVTVSTTAAAWTLIDVPLADFPQVEFTGIDQFKLVTSYLGTAGSKIYVDDVYFYNESADCNSWLTDATCEGNGIDKKEGTGSADFVNGYTYSIRSYHNSLIVTYNLLETGVTPTNALIFIYNNAGAQMDMRTATLSNGGLTATFEFTGNNPLTAAPFADGDVLYFGGKFEYPGGLYQTAAAEYTVGSACAMSPLTVPANREDLLECQVQSVYGTTKYTPSGIVEWGFNAGTVTQPVIDGKSVYKVADAGNGGGIVFDGVDLNGYDYMHIDVWCASAQTIRPFLRIYDGGWQNSAARGTIAITAATWASVDIPLSTWSDMSSHFAAANRKTLSFDDLNGEDYYFANFYFYKNTPALPVIGTASFVSLSGTSAILNLTATQGGSAVTTFRVTNETTGASGVYTADGSNRVTVPDMATCVTNVLKVAAVYDGCFESAESTINVTGPAMDNSANIITTSTVFTASHIALGLEQVHDGNTGTRWGTGDQGYDDELWINADLGSNYNVTDLKIVWERACPSDYYIESSYDGVSYYPLKRLETVPVYDGSATTYSFGADGLPMRHVRVRTVHQDTQWGISAWEIEAYGKCFNPLTAPIATFARLESQDANAGRTAVDAVLEVGAISPDVPFANMTYEVVLTPARDGSASETITVSSTSPAGFFTLTGLAFSTTYTATIYPIYNTSQRGTPATVTFTTPDNAPDLYFRNAMDWQDAALNVAYRFEYVGNTNVCHFSCTPNTNELQYRLYHDDNGDKLPGDADGWSVCFNQFLLGKNATVIDIWALDKDHFVGDYDNVYVKGAAVGANSDAASLPMTWDAAEQVWTWTGPVTSSQDFRIIVKAQENNNPAGGAFTTHSKSRIMDTDDTYSESWTYAKLTFDPVTWTWWWEEDYIDPYCTEEGTTGHMGWREDDGFTDGYRVTMITHNDPSDPTQNSVTVKVRVLDSDLMTTAYFKNYRNRDQNDAHLEKPMTKISDNYFQLVITPGMKSSNYPAVDLIEDWSYGAAIRYGIKFEYPGGTNHMHHTGPDYYYMQVGCAPDTFVIYHHGQTDAALHPHAVEQFAGGKILQPIQYRRYLTPNQWHTLILPFDVNDVKVWDPDDDQWYSLYPRYSSDGQGTMETANENDYWLRAFRGDVDQDHFERNWYDGFVGEHYAGNTASQLLPKKNEPYIIRVPGGDYYTDKPLVFCGDGYQTISADNSVGARPTADDSFRYLGNLSMMPMPTFLGYMLLNAGTEFHRRAEATIYPFECYVLANAETTARVPIIKKRTGQPTSLDEEITDNSVLTGARLYSAGGQLLRTYSRASVSELRHDCGNLAEGVYIINATTEGGAAINLKMILGGRR